MTIDPITKPFNWIVLHFLYSIRTVELFPGSNDTASSFTAVNSIGEKAYSWTGGKALTSKNASLKDDRCKEPFWYWKCSNTGTNSFLNSFGQLKGAYVLLSKKRRVNCSDIFLQLVLECHLIFQMQIAKRNRQAHSQLCIHVDDHEGEGWGCMLHYHIAELLCHKSPWDICLLLLSVK